MFYYEVFVSIILQVKYKFPSFCAKSIPIAKKNWARPGIEPGPLAP